MMNVRETGVRELMMELIHDDFDGAELDNIGVVVCR